MDNHIRHPEAERSDNTEPQSHLRLLNSREQVKWSASIMLSLNWRNQAISLRTLVAKATQRHLTLVDVRTNHCVPHKPARTNANLQRVHCAAHAQTVLLCRPSANISD